MRILRQKSGGSGRGHAVEDRREAFAYDRSENAGGGVSGNENEEAVYYYGAGAHAFAEIERAYHPVIHNAAEINYGKTGK